MLASVGAQVKVNPGSRIKGQAMAMTRAHHTTVQPQRGPTRHQRSAQISEEVRLLNRDAPSLSPSTPRNDGADFGVGPQGTGEPGPPGRMGENMSPQREGPHTLGVGRPVRSQDDEEIGVRESWQIRGVRTSGGQVEDPLQGDAAVLPRDPGTEGATKSERSVARPHERAVGDIESEQSDMVTPPASRKSRIQPPGTPYEPPQPTREDLAHSGNNSSTIAAGNFEGVLADRVKIVAEPGQIEGQRDIELLAQKLLHGQFARLRSQDEKDAVLSKVKEIERYEANLTSQQRAHKNPVKAKGHAYFQPLPESVRKSLVDKMVRGVYHGEGVLKGVPKHKQPVLNNIAKTTMLNGTYLNGDSERLLQKVRSLLPVAASQGAQRGKIAARGQRQQQQARK